MIRYLVAGVKHAFGLQNPGRLMRILPDDIFLVSYPKSGNTWARFLLANLIHPEEPASFANIHLLIPDPGGTTKRELDRMPRPRIIKSHTCFDPRYRRVIYIVRDPRDVALSQLHFHRKRKLIGDDYPLDDFVTRFLAGQTCPHGSWGQNVTTWLATRWHQSRFLLLRYEDMMAAPARELARVAEFLGLAASFEQIAQAVERSSADKMRENEKAQGQRSTMIKGSRSDIPFVRSAKAGGWRTGLPEPQVARIEAAWGGTMSCLGYELVTRDSESALSSSLIASLTGATANKSGEHRHAVITDSPSTARDHLAERVTTS